MLASRRRIRPLLVKLPKLVAIAAMPLASGVVPLVLESHGDSVVGERPEGLHQTVFEFPFPLAGEKLLNLLAAGNELAPIAPDRVFGVGQGDTNWIAGVPCVFSQSHLERCRLDGERRSDDRR